MRFLDSLASESAKIAIVKLRNQRLEDILQIVGIDIAGREETHVHTIDMWFSRRRNVWLVERLNADGDVVGSIHRCETEEDARGCVQEWLRAHAETHLLAPRDQKVPRKSASKTIPREKRRAA